MANSPDWLREALRQSRNELYAFFRTAVQFTLSPTRFARSWASGEARALNPLAFLATSLAGMSFVILLAAHVSHHVAPASEAPPSLVEELLGNLGPFAYYLLFGVLEHATLWLFGLRRPVRDACAMALYAGGGPAALMALVALGLIVPIANAHPAKWLETTVLVLVSIGYGLFMTVLASALAGLHEGRIRSYHLVVSNLAAMVVSGFIMGFDPPGQYGLHFVWSLHHAKTWDLSFSLTTGR